MKRDARIGLAVVLVLGLSVTLLIGRALYKNTEHLAEGDAEGAPGAAPSSSEVQRVDGAVTANAAHSSGPIIEVPQESARPAELGNPAVQRFVEDQTRVLGHAQPASQPPLPAPTAAPGAAQAPGFPGIEESASIPAHERQHGKPKPPRQDKPEDSGLADHEHATPPGGSAAGSDAPGDGFAYTVAAGDNIWKISSKVYGDGKYTQKILQANGGLNADKIKVGSVLRIPVIPNKTVLMKLPAFADSSKGPAKHSEAVAQKAPADAPAGSKPVLAEKKEAAPASTEATTHKVESGETLGTIAKKHFGFSGPKSIARIVEANPGLNPAKLKVGQELVIPAKK